jgi:hypothetical protein
MAFGQINRMRIVRIYSHLPEEMTTTGDCEEA